MIMKRILVLIAVVLLALGLPIAFFARASDVCTPRDQLSAEIKSHPMFVAVRDLTATESATLVEQVITSGGPDAAAITHGLLALREDGGMAFMVWEIDGSCGLAMLPPSLAATVMRALRGTVT